MKGAFAKNKVLPIPNKPDGINSQEGPRSAEMLLGQEIPRRIVRGRTL